MTGWTDMRIAQHGSYDDLVEYLHSLTTEEQAHTDIIYIGKGNFSLPNIITYIRPYKKEKNNFTSAYLARGKPNKDPDKILDYYKDDDSKLEDGLGL